MKALIFNSGIGKRMGELTKNSPKSMVKLYNGETVFERQIRILKECGIKEFIVTTGPFEEQLIAVTKKQAYKDLVFHFVHNDKYDTTNYIYSAYLAKDFLNDDFITLHGDLVFNKNLVKEVLSNQDKSAGLINKKISLPEKDFKARVVDGKITEVGINIFDENCYAFQPFYKLCKEDVKIWIDSIIDFIENRKNFTVYAENAFNEVSHNMNVIPMSYEKYYINEIDNIDDYERVNADIKAVDYAEQDIYFGIENLEKIVKVYCCKKPLLVIDGFLMNSDITAKIKGFCEPVFFSDFKPNPLYEDVVQGVELFKDSECDCIISIGGGSAIDTAKSIKLFMPLDNSKNYLEQEHVYINIPHIAIPTTAGTGSESTRYAVVYYNGVKQSLTDNMIIPNTVLLETEFLKTLPNKQKAATVLDALCQGIESMWSVNSTEVSKIYAEQAVTSILKNIDSYMVSDESVLEDIMIAANNAGKAINITQTTAAHAMSYKITSMYKIPHGQAVALCLPYVWQILSERYKETIDVRGEQYLRGILDKINLLFKVKTDAEAIERFNQILVKLNAKVGIDSTQEELELLTNSVNITRLKNFPVTLTRKDLYGIYKSL